MRSNFLGIAALGCFAFAWAFASPKFQFYGSTLLTAVSGLSTILSECSLM